jgi:hypothetical protein
VVELNTILQQFDNEEKKDIAQRIVEHESFKALLLEYITFSKGLKKALQALGSMQEAYATLTFARQGQNSLFKNILVTTVVSNVVNTSQQHITKTIGATRYMVWKTVECRVHVDETRKTLWGELP